MYATHLTCLSCGHDVPLDSPFGCPVCGGNQEVAYDFEALRASWTPPAGFETGRRDIWRYAALLPVRGLDHVPPVRVGATPLYPAPRLAAHAGLRHVFVKDDGLNPSASFKDRASAVVAARAAAGLLPGGAGGGAPRTPINGTGGDAPRSITVAGASTGNAGSSMACMAAALGLRAVVFVPKAAPPAKIAQLLTFGAAVVAVEGSYDDAFALCEQVCAERGWLNRNTGRNPFTREGKKTCALEIGEQLAWRAPDRVFVSVGDGNILTGLWKGFRDLHAAGVLDRLPRLVAVQSERSNAIARAFAALRAAGTTAATFDPRSARVEPVRATTCADSISVDTPADGPAALRALFETDGETVEVSDEAILAAIPLTARLTGVFAEPAGAASVAGLLALAARGTVAPEERVVCVVTGSGLKDVAAARRVAGEPLVIEPTPAAFAAAWRE
jgi:threonine synthase